MAETQRRTVTFNCPGFNTTTEQPHFINEGNFGEDVAKRVGEELKALGCTVQDEIGQEDHGWYVSFTTAGTPYTFVVGIRDADTQDWVGWVERDAGCLGSMFGGRARGIADAALRVVAAAVRALPGVTNIQWHVSAAFDAGREDEGTSEP